MEKVDFYKVLEVESDCKIDEIKVAYKKLALVIFYI